MKCNFVSDSIQYRFESLAFQLVHQSFFLFNYPQEQQQHYFVLDYSFQHPLVHLRALELSFETIKVD